MAEEAVRAVLEGLFLGLPPPESGVPRGGALLVALTAEGGDTGQTRCTVTVAAAGELSHHVDAETLRRAARGVLELRPHTPAPCCDRILRRARLRSAFQLSAPPGTLPPDSVALRRFLHKTSVVHPQVEFHFCVSVNGAVTSHTYGRESPGGAAGARLRVQSRHFAPPAPPGDVPPCGRIHPAVGTPLRLRVPSPAAAAGLGGDISIVPTAALCPCLRPVPNRPSRLAAVALFLYDPAGLPAAPPPLLRDPSCLRDWGLLGLGPPRAPPEEEAGGGHDPSEPVTPDVTYAVGPAAAAAGDGHPQTLLLFLLLRHRDPFGAYDAATRRLLLAHLDQTLSGNRRPLASGLRCLVRAALDELRRRRQGQQRVARSLPVAVAAVTAVVAASTSARFRRACLRAMQVEDTPALVAATRRSLADVTRGRLVPCAACDTRRGSPPERPRVRRGHREEEEEEEEEEDARPQSSGGQAWWREVAE